MIAKFNKSGLALIVGCFAAVALLVTFYMSLQNKVAPDLTDPSVESIKRAILSSLNNYSVTEIDELINNGSWEDGDHNPFSVPYLHAAKLKSERIRTVESLIQFMNANTTSNYDKGLYFEALLLLAFSDQQMAELSFEYISYSGNREILPSISGAINACGARDRISGMAEFLDSFIQKESETFPAEHKKQILYYLTN